MPDTMGKMDIAFPNLGIYLKNVPQYIYIGNFSIAVYGILIAIGMILGIVTAAKIARKTGQNEETYWDMSIWLIIFALIGARIYYVVFFWDAYKDNLLQIFNFRAGGLAIYGGVIAGIITAYVYCVIKRLYLPEVLDTLAYGLMVGQIIGRWGNFFNREVFGQYSDGLFAMRLPIEMVRERDISEELAEHIVEGTNYIQVHPTFLYESVWNLCLLIFLLIFLKHRKFKGEIFWMYLAGYGIGRAWIEYIRTDQLYIPGTKIPVNMVVAIVLAAISIAVIIWVCIKKKGMSRVGYGINTKIESSAELGETVATNEETVNEETVSGETESDETEESEKAESEEEKSETEETETEETEPEEKETKEAVSSEEPDSTQEKEDQME